jgi:ankyrin repeat protein
MHQCTASNDANVMSAQAAIDAGADVNYLHGGFSCLMVASLHGNAKIVALLLNAGADNAGADKEAKGLNDATALLMTVQNGHAGCMELLNAGANKEAKQIHGFTSLLVAA